MPGLGIGPGTAFRQGLLAARPVAEPSLEGYFFFATDVNGGTLYQCDGSAWIAITGGTRNVVAGSGISVVSSPSAITVSSTYSLPIASGSTLGGIKVGSGLFIDAGGVLSATTIGDATTSVPGLVIIDRNPASGHPISITQYGLLQDPPAVGSRGLLNIGSLPFGGVTSDRFHGTSAGTYIAINQPSSSNANILDYQVDGVSAVSLTARPRLIILSDFGDIIVRNTAFTYASVINTAFIETYGDPTAVPFGRVVGYSVETNGSQSFLHAHSDTEVGLSINTKSTNSGTWALLNSPAGAAAISLFGGFAVGGTVKLRVYNIGSSNPLTWTDALTANPNGTISLASPLGTTYGGTGLDTHLAANGQLLIGNGTGLSLATLTAGTNVTIVNGSGSITISASGGGGGGLTLYQTTVMADNPIGFWPLTEQGTAIGAVYADISGNSRDVAVLLGNVTHVEGITAGTTAPYFLDPGFSGTSDALWTSNTVGLPVDTEPYTLEGWIKPNTSLDFDYTGGAGSDMAWIAYGKPNQADYLIGTDFRSSIVPSGGASSNDNRIRLNGQNNADASTKFFTHAALATGWHHIVVSDDAAGTIKIYIDGYLVLNYGAAGTSNGLVYDAANVLFFGDPGFDGVDYPAPLAEEYSGAVSHYAIYDYVLTDAQVLNHFMVAKNTTASPDLVADVLAFSGNLNTTIASNANVAVPLDHTAWDNGVPIPQHDNSTNNTRLTCQEDGLYQVTGRLDWQSAVYDGFFTIRIWKNRTTSSAPLLGTVAETSVYITGNPNNSIIQTTSGQVRLAKGDYVELIASQLSNSSANRFLNSAQGNLFDYTQCRLHMVRIG